MPRTSLNMSNSILGAFQGLSQNCCFPPDVQVAAGKKYLLEMVNLDGAIYTKDGTLVKAFGLERFFNPSVGSNIIDEMTDPVFLFDNLSERWFASISDITEHSIRVAVSKTEDPIGIWTIYNFPFMSQPNNCSDQPFIGVSEDKVVVTVNNWGNDCNWSSGMGIRGLQGLLILIHKFRFLELHVHSTVDVQDICFHLLILRGSVEPDGGGERPTACQYSFSTDRFGKRGFICPIEYT
ncbi:MAG: hypothetical protein WA323_27645 [Candidatus Nitrosopolaris sp.]|jgi:hypothetical protein